MTTTTLSTDVSSNTRTKDLLEDLERILLAFMRKHRVTHEQYRAATQLLIASIKNGEESLLPDVFFEAESTDIGNLVRSGSPEAIEGPFYLPGAPELQPPCVLPMRDDEAGDVLLFTGSVRDRAGKALAGAELDLWQADAAGLYSNIFPSVPPWNLRGRIKTDADGLFAVRTIVPPPYEIPKNGPTGTVLRAMGRHFFRPAHLHVKVRHPSVGEMTSQIYFVGGEYLDSDVANAVREGLVVPLERRDADAAQAGPHYVVKYDFVLTGGQ